MGRLSKELKPTRERGGLRLPQDVLEAAMLDDRPIEVMVSESVIVIRAADLPTLDWQDVFARIRGRAPNSIHGRDVVTT